ncbi:MAG: type VI secretion system ImpA family N-terminal domain-containing protein [Paracoccaceae bacterium]
MDPEAFLAPLDPSAPSGADLRNDARFHALENRLQAASRAARLAQVAQGGTGRIDLDWGELGEEAGALAASGRDLRLLVIVARLWTNENGLAGVAAGLKLLAQTVEQHWETVHPALRPANGKREAALRRINALYQIENPDGGVLGDLEFVTLMSPRGLGAITGGDLAAGAVSRNAFNAEAPSGLGDKELADLVAKHEARLNRVTVACKATANEQPDLMAELKTGVADALAGLAALEAALDPHVTENDVAVRFAALGKFLTRIGQTLDAAGSPAAAAQPAQEAQAMSAPQPLCRACGPRCRHRPRGQRHSRPGQQPPRRRARAGSGDRFLRADRAIQPDPASGTADAQDGSDEFHAVDGRDCPQRTEGVPRDRRGCRRQEQIRERMSHEREQGQGHREKPRPTGADRL